MKNYKTCEVTFAKTEENTGLYYRNSCDTLEFNPDYKKEEFDSCFFYHMHIVSNDKIKEGEWFNRFGTLYQHKGLDSNSNPIIASTDKLITPNAFIPNSFLKLFAESSEIFNQTVEIEITEQNTLQTNKDGSVIVRMPKQYSYEEVKVLSDNLLNLIGMFDNPINRRNFNPFQQEAIELAKESKIWIENNL